jgi:hypothetical protein
MKTLNLALLLAPLLVVRAFAGYTGEGDWGVATNDVQMSIRMKSVAAIVKTNEPTILTVRFRNISTNRTFAVFVHGPVGVLPGLRLAVAVPSGKTLMLPAMPGDGSGHMLPLHPGQTCEVSVDLNRFCRLSEPGNYEITATFDSLLSKSMTNNFDITSNKLRITVPNEK